MLRSNYQRKKTHFVFSIAIQYIFSRVDCGILMGKYLPNPVNAMGQLMVYYQFMQNGVLLPSSLRIGQLATPIHSGYVHSKQRLYLAILRFNKTLLQKNSRFCQLHRDLPYIYPQPSPYILLSITACTPLIYKVEIGRFLR